MPFPEGFGKKLGATLSPTPTPAKSPNLNLTAALRASLESIDNPLEDSPEGFDGSDSPLEQVGTDAVDILLDRINEHLAEGMPEKITDDLLRRTVDIFRAQALQWEQEEAKPKTPRQSRKEKVAIEKLELDL